MICSIFHERTEYNPPRVHLNLAEHVLVLRKFQPCVHRFYIIYSQLSLDDHAETDFGFDIKQSSERKRKKNLWKRISNITAQKNLFRLQAQCLFSIMMELILGGKLFFSLVQIHRLLAVGWSGVSNGGGGGSSTTSSSRSNITINLADWACERGGSGGSFAFCTPFGN